MCPAISTTQNYAPNVIASFFLTFKSNLLMKRAFLLLNAAVSMESQYLVARVDQHLDYSNS